MKRAWKGSKRDREARAKAREARIVDYCRRHGLPVPVDAVEATRIDMLAFEESMKKWRAAMAARKV